MAPPNSSYLTQLQDLSLSPFFSKQANKQPQKWAREMALWVKFLQCNTNPDNLSSNL